MNANASQLRLSFDLVLFIPRGGSQISGPNVMTVHPISHFSISKKTKKTDLMLVEGKSGSVKSRHHLENMNVMAMDSRCVEMETHCSYV